MFLSLHHYIQEAREQAMAAATAGFDHVLKYEDLKAMQCRFKEAIAKVEPDVVPMNTVWGYGRCRWDEVGRCKLDPSLKATCFQPLNLRVHTVLST